MATKKDDIVYHSADSANDVEVTNPVHLMNLKIGGSTYKVYSADTIYVSDDDDSTRCRGLCIYKDRVIYVDADQSENSLIEVLIHEALHAISDRYGLDLDEKETTRLASYFSDMLIDNYELTYLIFKENEANAERQDL